MSAATVQDQPRREPWLLDAALRGFSVGVTAVLLAFLINNYLVFWHGWPGLSDFFSHQGWFWHAPLRRPLESGAVSLGWIQLLIYLVPVAAGLAYVQLTRGRALRADSAAYSAIAAYIIRGAFWSVLLIGLVDAAISFLRVEGFLVQIVGDTLAKDLSLSSYRGLYVHFPLVIAGFVIAGFVRSLGFTWLALLVVVAELLIVLTRFIFSYEQAFMGDLVRFWYAGLFLFASAYTLIEEGHVRVDVLYARFDERGRAWTNAIGSLFLGIPLCWVILALGMRSKATVINGPLLSFEVSQSGFGMYVKYLMAGFLAVFAVSMLIQFVSYFLSAAADLRGEPGHQDRESQRAP